MKLLMVMMNTETHVFLFRMSVCICGVVAVLVHMVIHMVDNHMYMHTSIIFANKRILSFVLVIHVLLGTINWSL